MSTDVLIEFSSSSLSTGGCAVSALALLLYHSPHLAHPGAGSPRKTLQWQVAVEMSVFQVDGQ